MCQISTRWQWLVKADDQNRLLKERTYQFQKHIFIYDLR